MNINIMNMDKIFLTIYIILVAIIFSMGIISNTFDRFKIYNPLGLKIDKIINILILSLVLVLAVHGIMYIWVI